MIFPESPHFTTDYVIEATGGELVKGNRMAEFKGVSTDSRKIRPGNLFVALMGDRFDGHRFTGDAVKGGAAGLIVQGERASSVDIEEREIPVISVSDTLRAYGDIAARWRGSFDIPVVAVTGSSGKTTTKEMICSVLQGTMNVLKSRGNYNNLVGLPFTLLELNDAHEAVVLEMGTSVRGEIRRLTEIAGPDAGVVTNVGPAHLEGFRTIETVREEKGDLFFSMRKGATAVFNIDDPEIRVLRERWKGPSVTFGMSEYADVFASNLTSLGDRGTEFTLAIEGKEKRISMPVIGEHNVMNALAAAAVCMYLGIIFDSICDGLESFREVQGRMAVIRLKNGGYVIDDAYNANPASVKKAVETLNSLKKEHRGILFLGDMLELGEKSEELHEEIGGCIASSGTDRLFIKGNYALAVARGAKKNGMPASHIRVLDEPEYCMASLLDNFEAGDWVLVKGSRKMAMEHYVKFISEAFGVAEK